MIINEVNVIERGWAGHFMFADRCLFRRNTLLEYKGIKWIVSTVGNYRNSKNRIDSIEHCKWYETMAYEAKEKNGSIEANVEKKIYFNSKCGIWGDSWEEVCKNCNDAPDNTANDMHDKVVGELIDKIKEQYNFNLTKTIRDTHDKVAKEIYCKGVDDLAHEVKKHYYVLSDVINSGDYGLFTFGIEHIAEELKAGVKNEN